MIGVRWVLRGSLYCLIALLGASVIASGIILFEFWLFLKLPAGPGRETRSVEIAPGQSAGGISRILETERVIGDARKFYLLCRLRQSGHKLQAGEYAFLSFSTPAQILDQMVSGRVVLHRVTFPEGSTVREVAKIFEAERLATAEAVLQSSHDKTYIRSLGLQVPSLEGYLFPETYYFSRKDKVDSILRTMVRQFWSHFPDSWQEHAEERGLAVHDVVILASMVEKEAVIDSERPVIAAVFFNRIRKDMPLQSDPTAVYDLTDFIGPITSEHLKRQSPYNTYQIKGLPAGPICNPGAKSIQAVVFPDEVPYLYFVSNNDGTHHFSETLADHQGAVSRYRQRMRVTSGAAQRPLNSEYSSHGIGILERIAPQRGNGEDDRSP